MGNCKYCGENAGWFSDHHNACLSRYQFAASTVSKGVAEVLKQHNEEGLTQFKNAVKSIDKPALVSFSDLCLMALEAWQRAVDEACYTVQSDLELTGEQIAFYLHFYQTVFFWMEPLPPNFRDLIARYYEEVVSLQVGEMIRRICLGEGVDRLAMGDPKVDSINYLPGEFPVMVIENVRIETQQTTYVRNYGGPSFRVAPGLYWRIGQSQGQPRTSLVVDERAGHLILTNMGVYYSNAADTFYIPCAQILERKLWCPSDDLTPRASMGMLLKLRNGKQFGFLMGSALHSLAFVKLLGLSSGGAIHAKKQSRASN